MDWLHLSFLTATTLATNIPLGILRSFEGRTTWRWLLGLHVYIAGSILLRNLWNVPWWTIPLTLGVAVLAQALGRRLGRRKNWGMHEG